MKTRSVILGMLGLVAAGCAGVKSAITVMPGVTIPPVPTNLSGRLVFLAPWDINLAQPASNAAAIYAYRLADGKLRKLASAPGAGNLSVSKDGRTFCVMYGWAVQSPYPKFTKAFLYSERTGQSRIFDLTQIPDGPALILVEKDRLSFKQVPGKTVYTFDLQTPDTRPVRETRSSEREVDDMFGCADAQGRYVFFEGSNGPRYGYTLVSSSQDSFWTAQDHGKGNQVKVLKRFSRTRGNDFYLCGLSPCRRYGLVRFTEAIMAKGRPGEVRSYYVVDTTNGATSLLLQDAFAREGLGSLSQVYWVGESGH